jgi:hypothetical protein
MKTITFLIILIISAFLLIGAEADAQERKPDLSSDHDWVDSLAIKYRNDYIQAQLSKDKDTLAYYKSSMDRLRERAIQTKEKEPGIHQQANDARHLYEKEKQAQKIRKRIYKKEEKAARTDFTRIQHDN